MKGTILGVLSAPISLLGCWGSEPSASLQPWWLWVSWSLLCLLPLPSQPSSFQLFPLTARRFLVPNVGWIPGKAQMQTLLAEPGEAECCQPGFALWEFSKSQGLSSWEMGRGRQDWSSLSLLCFPELPPPRSVTRARSELG